MSASLSRGLQVSVRAQGQGVKAKAEFLVILFFPPFPLQQVTISLFSPYAADNFPPPRISQHSGLNPPNLAFSCFISQIL